VLSVESIVAVHHTDGTKPNQGGMPSLAEKKV